MMKTRMFPVSLLQLQCPGPSLQNSVPKMLQKAKMVWLLKQNNPWLDPHLLEPEATQESLVVARILNSRSSVHTREKITAIK